MVFGGSLIVLRMFSMFVCSSFSKEMLIECIYVKYILIMYEFCIFIVMVPGLYQEGSISPSYKRNNCCVSGSSCSFCNFYLKVIHEGDLIRIIWSCG
uniref:Uncharacterized protein n=1 Tax=Panstrongylus lignarius TaxID=156445 RepID=A0A224Y2T6_9HEMI